MTAYKLKTYAEPSESLIRELVLRPALNTAELSSIIDGVFQKVAEGGDQALIELTSQFDGVALESVLLSEDAIKVQMNALDPELKKAIDIAYNNITTFHKAQQLEIKKIETCPGVQCWQESRAIDAVGIYIPGGTAPLFSTVLMLGIPAQIAACKQVVMCSPPNKEGNIHPAMLYAATLCGITQIATVGGAQAIAAMVQGTDSIPAVYKVFGPGNQYVTAAKMKGLQYGVAIDMPAGPSEVLVYADESCVPAFVAADLLSQAEHGVDSQVVLVATTDSIVEEVSKEIDLQLEKLPRKDIAQAAMKHAYACVIGKVQDAYSFINKYAPEHFIICSDQAEAQLSMIQNAGSVFIGHWTPESAGDYASGTNHTLPTASFSRAYSGVSLDSFIKKITFQKISKDGINALGPTIMTMAHHEQLDGHANAVKLRMEAL